jgi:hypothetical protein
MTPLPAPRKAAGEFSDSPAPQSRSAARTMTDGMPGDGAGTPTSGSAEGKAFNHGRHRWMARVVRDRVLSRSALAVAGIVWDSMNARLGCAWPSVNYIARELRINRASVFRGLNELYRRGWLTKEQGRRGRSNRYRIAFGSFDLDGAGRPDTDKLDVSGSHL